MIRLLFILFTTLLLIACFGLLQNKSDEVSQFDFITEESQSLNSYESETQEPLYSSGSNLRVEEKALEDNADAIEFTDDSKRKRIYNGSASIIIDDVEDTRQRLEAMANNKGGYVESSFTDRVIIRVPADDFDEVFEAILDLGELKSSRIATWDVTDIYNDTKAQMESAMRFRERLYTLLENSRESEERAKILKEIGRISEEIATLKQYLDAIDDRIVYSRIIVELIPRLSYSDRQFSIPFEWIDSFDPLTPTGTRLAARLDIDPGSDFAIFSREKIFLAENAEGTLIAVSSIENSPQADTAFWQEALLFHLGPLYAESSLLNTWIGETQVLGVDLLSKDRNPYRVYIGVVADARKLHILQIYLPHEDLDLDDLLRILAEGEWQ